MKPSLNPLAPAMVAAGLNDGRYALVDIREPDEFASRHVAGAISRPLSRLGRDALPTAPGREVVFMCRSGMRTSANCERLAAAIGKDAFVLAGGLDAWAAAGLPTAGGG